jgi:glycosyltransferase involved in cell wall biosynthesis
MVVDLGRGWAKTLGQDLKRNLNEVIALVTVISVVIPAFNRAHSVGAAIDSALAQDLPPGWSLEVVVADDASSDDLAGALGRFDVRVRLVRHSQNAGAAAARNTAAAAARGDWLAFLDSDDAWLPSKLSRQIEAMQSHDWQASCTAYVLHRRGEFVSPKWPTGALGLDRLAFGCFVSPGSTLLVSRQLFEAVGPFDQSLERYEDWDWLMRLTATAPLGFLAVPLARVEPSGFADLDKAMRALAKIRAKHLDRLPPALRRRLEAGLAVENAAAHHRCGHRLTAATGVLRSLWHVPLRNAAVAAVLSNALASRSAA